MADTGELEDRLREVGSRLAPPPSGADELLSLLNQTGSLLSRVEQSPTDSMLNALKPSIEALVDKGLLGHSDIDVRVAIASCFSEITRITAPESPYNDDLMKELFQRTVQAFEDLDDMSSRSFLTRVSILETVAKVRSCVVMLDLECDSLILKMFHHFFRAIRPNHPEIIFSSMETIMTLVLEESEDISLELILCLLDSVKSDNKDILPIAHSLGKKVITNCAGKLKPYLVELSQSNESVLREYGRIVASICQETSDSMEKNIITAAETMESKKSEQIIKGCSEEVTAKAKIPEPLLSNGTVQMVIGESSLEPSSNEQPELSNDQSKNGTKVNRDVSDIGAVQDSLQKEFLDRATPKRSRGRGRGRGRGRASSRQSSGEVEQFASSLQQGISEMLGETTSLKNSQLQMDPDGVCNFDIEKSSAMGLEEKPQRLSRTNSQLQMDSDGVCNFDIEKSSAMGLEEKPQRLSRTKGFSNKSNQGHLKQKSRLSKLKDHDHLIAKKLDEESTLEELFSSKSAAETPKVSDNLEQSGKTKSYRKRCHDVEEISETATRYKDLDGRLVGSRIRVWWPIDKRFYDGVVVSYDDTSERHKIVYTDGDVEKLSLRKECWKFTDDDGDMDVEPAKNSSNTFSSEEPKRKRARTSSTVISKKLNVETPQTSGTASGGRRKGRPPKVNILNLDNGPSSSVTAKQLNIETPPTSGTASGSRRKGRPPKVDILKLDDSPSSSATAKKLNIETPPTSGTASGNRRKGRPPKVDILKLDDSPSSSANPKLNIEIPPTSGTMSSGKGISPKVGISNHDDGPSPGVILKKLDTETTPTSGTLSSGRRKGRPPKVDISNLEGGPNLSAIQKKLNKETPPASGTISSGRSEGRLPKIDIANLDDGSSSDTIPKKLNTEPPPPSATASGGQRRKGRPPKVDISNFDDGPRSSAISKKLNNETASSGRRKGRPPKFSKLSLDNDPKRDSLKANISSKSGSDSKNNILESNDSMDIFSNEAPKSKSTEDDSKKDQESTSLTAPKIDIESIPSNPSTKRKAKAVDPENETAELLLSNTADKAQESKTLASSRKRRIKD